MNSSSAIWWRHLPVAYINFFEAGVSGNTIILLCRTFSCRWSFFLAHSNHLFQPLSIDVDLLNCPADFVAGGSFLKGDKLSPGMR
jgi:hypothetical protein